MDSIDFKKYTIEQLKSALGTIDKDKFPERAIEIKSILDAKMSDPLQVIQHEKENDFFCDFVPSEVVTGVWLRTIGWGFVFGMVVVFPIIFILSIVMSSMGYDDNGISVTIGVISWVISIGISWFVTRKALGAQLDTYEIVFYRKEN